MRRLSALLTLGLCLCFTANATYLKQITLTVDHTKVGSSDQTNFPVLVCANSATNCSATVAGLADSGHSGFVQHTSSLTFGGRTFTVPDDLVISSTACLFPTLLNWEIEAYTNTSGSLVLWFQAPTVSHTVDSLFYMCYDDSTVSTWQGNVTGTWSPYVYVNHGADGTTAYLYDSSPTGATIAAKVGSLTTNTAGSQAPPIAMGNGAGDLDMVSSVDLTSGVGTFGKTTHFTMEAWVYWFAGTGGAFDVAISQAIPTTANVFFFYFGGDDATGFYYGCLQRNGDGNDCVTGGTFATGVWVHHVITADGSNVKLYLNGSLAGTTAYANVTTATDNSLGFSTGGIWVTTSSATANRGIVRADEWRIMNGTTAGADYVTASYNSTNNPSTFVTIGVPSTVSGQHSFAMVN